MKTLNRALQCLFILLSFLSIHARAAVSDDSITVINAGISGHNTADLLSRVDKDVLSQKPDVVVLLVGTNDMINSKKLLSIKDFEKNYRSLINKLKSHSQLVLMTVPPFYKPYLLSRHPIEVYGTGGPENRVEQANAIIKKLAKEYNCLLIDLYKILSALGGATTDADCLFRNEANSKATDGVHLTANGYKVIATTVYDKLAIHESTKKLICFGDSITYGLYLEGGGTVEGKNYPSYLKKLINGDTR